MDSEGHVISETEYLRRRAAGEIVRGRLTDGDIVYVSVAGGNMRGDVYDACETVIVHSTQ